MKKMIACFAAVGMMLASVPAGMAFAAENISVTAEASDDTVKMTDIAGKWRYEISSGNYTVDVDAVFNGIVELNEDGTYTYTDPFGNVTRGTAVSGFEEFADGTKIPMIKFFEGNDFKFGGYFNTGSNDVLSIGVGGLERLVREKAEIIEIKDVSGKWVYEVSSGNYTVDVDAVFNGIVELNEDGTYTYTDPFGNVTRGTAVSGFEEFADGTKIPMIKFFEGNDFKFGGYFNTGSNDVLSIGVGGLARLVREPADAVDMEKAAGTWIYEVSDGNSTIDINAVYNGKVEINKDGTYTYTDADGNVSNGAAVPGFEEFADGTKIPMIKFFKGTELVFAGAFNTDDADMMSVGNGGNARLVRRSETVPAVTTSTASSETASSTTTTVSSTETASSSVPETNTTSSVSSGTSVTAEKAKYTNDELKDMAVNDFIASTGRTPAGAHVLENEDGTVTVVIDGEDGMPLEFYTVSPETGIGTKSDGSEADLPQTGNNSLRTVTAAAAAMALTFAGAFTVMRSGILRRKENE